jgi:hypothetical protein
MLEEHNCFSVSFNHRGFKLWGNANGSIPVSLVDCPHPKSLSLRERDFNPVLLLPKGEGVRG